jgi:hypothetical protein
MQKKKDTKNSGRGGKLIHFTSSNNFTAHKTECEFERM